MWNIWSYKQCIILLIYMLVLASLVFGYLLSCQFTHLFPPVSNYEE